MQVLPSTFRYERLLVSDYLNGLLYCVAAEAWSFHLVKLKIGFLLEPRTCTTQVLCQTHYKVPNFPVILTLSLHVP
jgi:hypothetical protein